MILNRVKDLTILIGASENYNEKTGGNSKYANIKILSESSTLYTVAIIHNLTMFHCVKISISAYTGAAMLMN